MSYNFNLSGQTRKEYIVLEDDEYIGRIWLTDAELTELKRATDAFDVDKQSLLEQLEKGTSEQIEHDGYLPAFMSAMLDFVGSDDFKRV